MKVCAVICRKAKVALPGANPSLPEHKIGVFVRFWLLGPSFSDFVVAHVLRIYDIAYCLKLHCGVWGH